jgi:hypothetical protein
MAGRKAGRARGGDSRLALDADVENPEMSVAAQVAQAHRTAFTDAARSNWPYARSGA